MIIYGSYDNFLKLSSNICFIPHFGKLKKCDDVMRVQAIPLKSIRGVRNRNFEGIWVINSLLSIRLVKNTVVRERGELFCFYSILHTPIDCNGIANHRIISTSEVREPVNIEQKLNFLILISSTLFCMFCKNKYISMILRLLV